MTFVFDTNVLFAAFATRGVCHGLYKRCLVAAQLVSSEAIVSELGEKLAAKTK